MRPPCWSVLHLLLFFCLPLLFLFRPAPGEELRIDSQLPPPLTAQLRKDIFSVYGRCALLFPSPCLFQSVRLNVIALQDEIAYAQLAGQAGVSAHYSAFYDPATARIVLYSSDPEQLRTMLRHEATHHFLSEAFDFRVPAAQIPLLKQTRLRSVPYWFQEGLASCMEDAHPRGLNYGRLTDLLRNLAWKRVSPVSYVLSREYGAPMSASDYATAWGIIYALLNNSRERDGRHLRQYLAECSAGFMDDPEREFADFFFRDGQPLPDFDDAWGTWIAQRSLARFEAIFLGRRRSLPAWEKRWQGQMVALTD